MGNSAGSGVITADDVICIGAAGANVSHSCYIGNIFNQSLAAGLQKVSAQVEMNRPTPQVVVNQQ